jgi:hypothetical protein
VLNALDHERASSTAMVIVQRVSLTRLRAFRLPGPDTKYTVFWRQTAKTGLTWGGQSHLP